MGSLLQITLAALLVVAGNAAFGGEVKQGKAVFQRYCAECHYASDFAGEKERDIAVLLRGDRTRKVHAGKAKLDQLTDEDVTSLAAYLASGK